MIACFYDIECFDNAFTLCNYIPHEDAIDLYYLADEQTLTAEPDFVQKITARIYERNQNFRGQIRLFDLREFASNDRLAMTFGLSDAISVNSRKRKDSFNNKYRPVCDTDEEFDDDKCPYFMGYNSYNYDTTVLAFYFNAYFCTAKDKNLPFPVTAREMRNFNDELFTDAYKNNMPSRLRSEPVADCIRKNMMMSGRHVDVARLNEKQQHVGLKRLIGMMGGQILESEKLSHNQSHIDNPDQFYDLVAYNVSDCVNLDQYVFHDRDKIYLGKFELKRGLLKTYPELIYKQKPGSYEPDIDPEKVRRDRLCIDSSSAQFATKSLCPYGHLKDIPVVSFMYPSEEKARENNIPRVNVLEEAKEFFYRNFPQPELRAEFDRIYRFYKNIEGKNFNDSTNYMGDFGQDTAAENIQKYSHANTCMFYYNKDGTPSTCFVTFSVGGIHGAEYNKALYDDDCEKFRELEWLFSQAKQQFPDPLDLKAAKTIDITMPDGSVQTFKSNVFLTANSTKKKSEYKDIEKKRPVLFQEGAKGTYELNKRYVFTSASETNHEDFTSYYPNLLRMMSAFYNKGLGYDRYAEIFEQKQKLGKVMKDKSLSAEQRSMAAVQREGTKLILNSASGAADATFESPIRMNNQIISMRIIGQLFSWRIGQAQTLEGARIISTNTDGLFSVLEAGINNAVLERESAEINVEIEPEPTYLISKDSNNRIEVDPNTGAIQRASGGSLACHKGPTPDKSLAHPAIIDWALCEYLVYHCTYPGKGVDKPFDPESGQKIFRNAPNHFDKTMLLNMYQNIISNSLGSDTYNFAIDPAHKDSPIPLQHYNRVYIMRDGAPMRTFHLYAAAARKITPATEAKRRKNGEKPQQHDQTAIQILTANGIPPSRIQSDKEGIVKKITGIDNAWNMLIMNRALTDLTEDEQDEILENLDYDKYLQMLQNSYENNWRNNLPQAEPVDTAEPDDTQPVETENLTNAPSTEEPPIPAEPVETENLEATPLPEEKPALTDTQANANMEQTETEPAAQPAVTPPAEPLETTPAESSEPIPTAPTKPGDAEPIKPIPPAQTLPPMPEPSAETWLNTIDQFVSDCPFPITPLDSDDEQELQMMGLRLIQEGWHCLKKAQEIREANGQKS